MSDLKTRIATSDRTSITVRGKSLTADLMGKRGFTEMIYFLTAGTMPSPPQVRVLDLCLVTLMEHGWVPASIITRLAADSAPGQTQVAMAAGLLAVGPVFAGTMEGCAELLAHGVREGGDTKAYCRRLVAEHRAAKTVIPGFGHRSHKPEDPRSPVIFEVLRETATFGPYAALLQELSTEVDAAAGKHITINATGAIAAALLEIGIPEAAMRGIAVISRAGGLLGHVLEEKATHSARDIWDMTRREIPYEDPPGD